MRFAAIAITALATSAFAYPSAKASNPVVSIANGIITDVVDFLHPDTILTGLCAEGAAAFVGASLGLKAEVIDVNARAKLAAWVEGASVGLDVDVKTAIHSWCTGSGSLDVDIIADISLFVPVAIGIAAEGGLVADLNGIASVGAAVGVILETSLQGDLSAFIKAHVDLDSEINVALSICAAGGLVTSLTAEVKAAITAWLSGAECTLSADLKAAVALWLKAEAGLGVVALGTVSTAASISASIGASLDVAVDVSGVVAASYISAIEAWINAQVSLDVNVKGWLEILIGGKSAAGLAVEEIGELTAWLFSSSCTLTAELKAVVLLWIHLRLGFTDSISVLAATDIATLVAWFKGDIVTSLSAAVSGAISVAIAGESVYNVSVEAIAELIGVLTGCVSGVDISIDIQIILGKWISGEVCDCHYNAKRGLIARA